MGDVISLVLDATGLVVRVAVGHSEDIPVESGETAVPREGAAAEAWIGWQRSADGSYALPVAPVVMLTEAALIAYAHEAHLAKEAAGTTWSGWPVTVNERAMTRAVGEVAAILIGAKKDTDPWTFADGVARPVSNEGLKELSLRMRRHVGVCLAVFNQVVAGIEAGQVTTTAQVDGAFAGVDAIVEAGA